MVPRTPGERVFAMSEGNRPERPFISVLCRHDSDIARTADEVVRTAMTFPYPIVDIRVGPDPGRLEIHVIAKATRDPGVEPPPVWDGG